MDTEASSAARVWWADARDVRRVRPAVELDPENDDSKSDMSGRVCDGGTKTVEAEPDADPESDTD